MKNIIFFSENFRFLEVKFSIYLNRRVFIMTICTTKYLLRMRKFLVCTRNFHVRTRKKIRVIFFFFHFCYNDSNKLS